MEINEADGLTNSLMSQFGADVALDVLHEFRAGWEVQKALAAVNQQRIAQSVERLEKSSIEGLGQHTHSVDLVAYLYWHARTNGECWKDPAFWEEYGRDNPATRVRWKQPGNRITHPGLPTGAAGPLVRLTGLDSFDQEGVAAS